MQFVLKWWIFGVLFIIRLYESKFLLLESKRFQGEEYAKVDSALIGFKK